MPRLTVVSDSHLSVANPEAGSNWDAVIDHLEATRPDLVVHTGDISADGVDGRSDLDHAKAQLDRIPVPWLAIPGNHDLGKAELEWAITRRRRARYEDVFGDRFWATDLGSFHLVGLDTEALVSGQADDEASWRWMKAELATGRPTVVFAHRPLAPISAAENDVDRRYVYEPHRSRLLGLLAEADVVAVISGHAHQWQRRSINGQCWIWVPSCWAVVSDDLQPRIGQKVVGLVEVDLDAIDQAELVIPEHVEHHIAPGARPRVRH